MQKIYLSAFLLLFSSVVNAQCLTATKGQFPDTAFTPVCPGPPENVTTQGYAGEYSKVNVISGNTYIFSSSVSTDFITISDSAGTTAYTSNTTPVTWTAPSSGIIRFYTHTNSACGEASTLRSRIIKCTTPGCPTISSVISVGATGDYSSLTAVAALLSTCAITAPVTIQLLRDYNSAGETYPVTFRNINGISAINTVTIKPAPGAIVAITGQSRTLLNIRSSYVTIDGSNNGTSSRDLTLKNSFAPNPFLLVIGSTGTAPITNVNVRNCIIINGGLAGGAALVVSDGGSAGSAGYFNNISILNNSVQKALYGIACFATVAAGNGSGLNISGNDLSTGGTNAISFAGIYAGGVDGATIAGNTIGNFTKGTQSERAVWVGPGTVNSTVTGNTISNLGLIANGGGGSPLIGTDAILVESDSAISNVLVSGNTITGVTISGSLTSLPSGIHISGNTSGVTIEKNKISNIKSVNAEGAYGIRLAGTATTGTITVANNFIYDIASKGSATVANNGHGIAVVSGTGYNIYYNSVHLNTNQTATTGLPAALFVGSGVMAAGSINVRNNIFSNSQTVGTNRYAIYSGGANTVFSAINYNDYYSAGPNAGFIGTNRANLAALQAGFGGNSNSVIIQPVFTSATDLHLPAVANTALANRGTPVAGFTTDIDNQARSVTAPDVGADEFDVAFIFSLTSGPWNNPATWSCNCVPQGNDQVTIKAGHTIIITAAMGNLQCGKLTLEATSVFNVTGGLFKIVESN